MKKNLLKVSIIVGLTFSALSTVYAATEYLAHYTSRTYVTNTHAGGLSIPHYGKLSICGTDRIGDFGSYYPVFCRISYVESGNRTRHHLYSKGQYDSVIRTKNVVYNDSFKFNNKVNAYAYVEKGKANEALMSTGEKDE